jgi:hypothetical protein
MQSASRRLSFDCAVNVHLFCNTKVNHVVNVVVCVVAQIKSPARFCAFSCEGSCCWSDLSDNLVLNCANSDTEGTCFPAVRELVPRWSLKAEERYT